MSSNHLHTVSSASLPYLLSLPPEADTADRFWPLLCFLHGYDEGAPSPIQDALTRHGPLKRDNPALASMEFIVIAPQLSLRGDLWHAYADAVLEIVEETGAQHPVDRSRRFLTGFSFGGNGVFDLAYALPDIWAALWAVDPTRVPEHEPECPVWLSSGEVSRRRGQHFIERLQLERLREEHPEGRSGKRIYTDDGQDHVTTATLAYRNERIYRWLLSQSAMPA